MEAYMDAKASTCSCGCGCRSRVVPGVSDRPAAQPEYSGPSHQMWPGWDMNQSLPYGEAGYPQTGYPQIGTNMNQGSTVWPIVNLGSVFSTHLDGPDRISSDRNKYESGKYRMAHRELPGYHSRLSGAASPRSYGLCTVAAVADCLCA